MLQILMNGRAKNVCFFGVLLENGDTKKCSFRSQVTFFIVIFLNKILHFHHHFFQMYPLEKLLGTI